MRCYHADDGGVVFDVSCALQGMRTAATKYCPVFASENHLRRDEKTVNRVIKCRKMAVKKVSIIMRRIYFLSIC